jgi:hypothetical protein
MIDEQSKTIETQRFAINARNEEIARANTTLEQKNAQIVDLLKQNSEMKPFAEKVKIHLTLQNFKEWLDANVKPTNIYYNFGSGSKPVHIIFAESIKDEGIIRSFIKDDLGFDGSKYSNADNLVFSFNVTLSRKYPTRSYYKTDEQLYGKLEYWATAKETILKIRNNHTYGDCDDSMTLRYSCLYYLLLDYFPQDLWRLRGFIVDIWTGGGHAMLAWVKGGVNDWVPVETTFYDDKQNEIWSREYTIDDQMLYQIRYSFDNIAEYAKK